MIKTLHKKHKSFHQKFLSGWIITTIAFAVLISFGIWQYARYQTLHEFDLHVHHLAFSLDELAESVLDSLDSIPAYSNTVTSCEQKRPELEKIIFNSPYLSGIVISSFSNEILCATNGSNLARPHYDSKRPVMFGPLKLLNSQNEVYLIQQRVGQYYIGTYFLKDIFDNLFKNHDDKFNFTGLYDTLSHKMIFTIGNDFPGKKLLEKPSIDGMIVDITETNQSIAILPINNLDNIKLVLSKSSTGFLKNMALKLLISLLPLLILSWWFYNYLKGLIRKRFSIENALRTALRENRFYPVYQPVRDVLGNKYSGAEVLIRLKTEFDEIILPEHFIDDAEKSGLIVPITLQLIERVFQECQPIFQQNPAFSLSFNLSPAHFRDKCFFAIFFELCQKYGIPAKQLMLELTERELFNESDKDLTDIMQMLRDRGYSLAIDDFGTGQANINYLQHFPFNYLKIDKIFVQTIGTGAIIESLNQGIINIGHSLGLTMIAEGVETKQQLDYLLENNVTLIQGWYYAKAMPFEQISKLFL